MFHLQIVQLMTVQCDKTVSVRHAISQPSYHHSGQKSMEV